MSAARNIKRTKRVALEEDKRRQTTHWDLDYLPMTELEALHSRPAVGRAAARPAKPPSDAVARRRWGLACLLAGLGLFLLALVLARWMEG